MAFAELIDSTVRLVDAAYMSPHCNIRLKVPDFLRINNEDGIQ